MRTVISLSIGLAIALVSFPAAAQVSLGGLPTELPRAGQILDPALGPVLGEAARVSDNLERSVRDLAADRVGRIDRLVRRNSSMIERDARGEPARAAALLAMNAPEQEIAAAEAAGYRVIEREAIEGLDLEIVRIAAPEGMPLAEAEAALKELMPQSGVSADNLYFQSGGTAPVAAAQGAPATLAVSGRIAVGMIDGAPGSATPVAALRGFAEGAGVASDHGSAVASLLHANSARRIHVADVYGTDPAGGNALAIARALGWLAGQGASVVTISLIGPENPVLARAIAAVQARGVVVVAAVGNDGPAAPPAYPASYAGVIAVTAVDGRERALIEAGRALHLDYAAPGADIRALDRRGRSRSVRGTSYATPLVAARIARALESGRNWRRTLDAEAIDLGEPGADPVFGRGLVCRGCGRAGRS